MLSRYWEAVLRVLKMLQVWMNTQLRITLSALGTFLPGMHPRFLPHNMGHLPTKEVIMEENKVMEICCLQLRDVTIQTDALQNFYLL